MRSGPAPSVAAEKIEALREALHRHNYLYYVENRPEVSDAKLGLPGKDIPWQTRRTNMVDVYVNYLRKKMDVEFQPRLIITHFGVGYELRDPEGIVA